MTEISAEVERQYRERTDSLPRSDRLERTRRWCFWLFVALLAVLGLGLILAAQAQLANEIDQAPAVPEARAAVDFATYLQGVALFTLASAAAPCAAIENLRRVRARDIAGLMVLHHDTRRLFDLSIGCASVAAALVVAALADVSSAVVLVAFVPLVLSSLLDEPFEGATRALVLWYLTFSKQGAAPTGPPGQLDSAEYGPVDTTCCGG